MGCVRSTAVVLLTLLTATTVSQTDVSRLVGTAVVAALVYWLLHTVIHSLLPTKLLPDHQRRAVLITGCDSGFGHALALRLDALGVPVYAGCISEDSEGAQRLRKICSSRTHVLQLDITSDQQVQDAVTYVSKTLGDNKLWAVMNNAGVSDIGEVELISLENMRRVEDVNLWGAVRVTKAFLPMLRESQGRLVFTSSPLGRLSLPLLAAYCMSKHALRSFCDSLRPEMNRWGVSVHIIEPGGYESNLNNWKTVELIRTNFNSCSTSVREAYGGDEYPSLSAAIARQLQSIINKSRDAILEVADEMVNAIVGCEPKIRHIPGIWEPIVYSILGSIPSCVVNQICCLFLGSLKKVMKTSQT